jgi:hypothetical protein
VRRCSAAAIRFVVCSTVLACRRDLGPVPDGPLMTDATGYVAKPIAGSANPVQYQFSVITRFENRSGAPVSLQRCLPDSPGPMYAIVLADSSALKPAYDPNWGCVAHNNNFVVLPGAVRVDTFDVRGPNAVPTFAVISGVFRLKLFVGSAPGSGAPAVRSLGISNAFIVHRSNSFAP